MIGDCSHCGHSAIYHLPFVGCTKCNCDEFHVWTVVLVAFLLVGCTDESGTRRTLDAAGFTDVQLDGYAWFSCGNGDNFATSFHAKNAAGRNVSGAVCCGILKNCTVRF